MKAWIYTYALGIPLVLLGIAYQGYLDYEFLNENHVVIKEAPSQKQSARVIESSFSKALLMGNPAQKAVVEKQALESLPETRLSFELKGIFLSEDPSLAGAVIEVTSGKPAFYGIGQEVSDETILVELMDNGVVLERGGRRETLLVKQAKGGG